MKEAAWCPFSSNLEMPSRPRIVLLHATPVAIDPVKAAFAELWPEPELVNLLDDSLSPDRARDPDLSQKMIDRFVALGRYAVSTGADAVLVTCSAFGPAIDVMERDFDVPVLKPNEAMFHAAVSQGSRIGMIATFGPSIPTMRAEFEEYIAETGARATLETILVEDAMTALRAGDAETHNRRIAERVDELGDVDTIMLAHFSTSRAQAAVQAKVSVPVLSAPGAAVTRLRELISSGPAESR
jgi:Asp/Glu/hydantoin racemase